MSEVKRVKISDLKPDVRNANKGTERGVYMLTESLRQYGAGRSILVDRDGNVIAGNKTLERAADLGFEDVIVVPTDGKTLVAVQREDLDLYDGDEARLLAYYDNRTSEVDLAWEAEQLLADQAAGVDLSGLWYEGELERLINPGEDDPWKEWEGMPEFENEEVHDSKIKVYFPDEGARRNFAELVGQDITPKTTFIWFPKEAKPTRQGVDKFVVEHEP